MTSRVFSKQRPWSNEAAATLLDMSAGLTDFEALGQQQLDAAVALHRMLLDHGVAYLGDEVGMGKTYVALAVVALMRHLQPEFKVLYLVPSRNVQSKWYERELPAFIRENVRALDVRSEGSAVACSSVEEWVKTAVSKRKPLDTFLRFSALSFDLDGSKDDWIRRVSALAELTGKAPKFGNMKDKPKFKARAASLVNEVLPRYDLVIVDEAHLLKDGTGPNASDRAQFLAAALGTLDAPGTEGRRRFGGALLLSGTPFDRDLRQLARQLQVFANKKNSNAPHRQVEELAIKRQQGMDWDGIHNGLAPYMIRRVQKMSVGGHNLSRNQYRVEHRRDAAICLKGNNEIAVVKQRLFTALVQKRLIDHLGTECDGRFPQAMFSSWEAYAPPRKRELSPAASIKENPIVKGDTLDVDHKGQSTKDSQAVDSSLIQVLVGTHKERFSGEHPPHPKLEREAKRLGNDAFLHGRKQLVFVRRLASINDLYWRLNREYDDELASYLGIEGLLTSDIWQKQAKNFLVARESTETSDLTILPEQGEGQNRDGEEAPEATRDTLFSWFFRGKLDDAGRRFAYRNALPHPDALRKSLRDTEGWECLIGELDWRGYLLQRVGLSVNVSYEELVAFASQIPGPEDRVGRYRRLQYAFVHLASGKCQGNEARALESIANYYRKHVIGKVGGKLVEMKVGTAENLLDCPTIALSLALDDRGREAILDWDETWKAVEESDAVVAARRLRSLDLHAEVMFSLMRLDHPFIDLYIAWRTVLPGDGQHTASILVRRVVGLFQSPTRRFGTAQILRDLAQGWSQVVKTNFADFARSDSVVPRSAWRKSIQQLVTPEGPVEWASGEKSKGRSAVARRFRMPGYPMALVSTSVLQEGEDLHVFCDRVTHFGISGSPIGIEQKNGRIDRIGSLAQRNLQKNPSIDVSGIQIWFPHLAESLEWYQVRELCLRLNDYQRSMHTVLPPTGGEHQQQLRDVIASADPIPLQLMETLVSPFEPKRYPGDNDVTVAEVNARVLAGSAVGQNACGGTGTGEIEYAESATHESHGPDSNIVTVLRRHRLDVRSTETRKWLAVVTTDPDFRKRFNTDRIGKLVNTKFYITVPLLDFATRELVNQAQLSLLTIPSSSSQRTGLLYPGFDTVDCSGQMLADIVRGLVTASCLTAD